MAGAAARPVAGGHARQRPALWQRLCRFPAAVCDARRGRAAQAGSGSAAVCRGLRPVCADAVARQPRVCRAGAGFCRAGRAVCHFGGAAGFWTRANRVAVGIGSGAGLPFRAQTAAGACAAGRAAAVSGHRPKRAGHFLCRRQRFNGGGAGRRSRRRHAGVRRFLLFQAACRALGAQFAERGNGGGSSVAAAVGARAVCPARLYAGGRIAGAGRRMATPSVRCQNAAGGGRVLRWAGFSRSHCRHCPVRVRWPTVLAGAAVADFFFAAAARLCRRRAGRRVLSAVCQRR